LPVAQASSDECAVAYGISACAANAIPIIEAPPNPPQCPLTAASTSWIPVHARPGSGSAGLPEAAWTAPEVATTVSAIAAAAAVVVARRRRVRLFMLEGFRLVADAGSKVEQHQHQNF